MTDDRLLLVFLEKEKKNEKKKSIRGNFRTGMLTKF